MTSSKVLDRSAPITAFTPLYQENGSCETIALVFDESRITFYSTLCKEPLFAQPCRLPGKRTSSLIKAIESGGGPLMAEILPILVAYPDRGAVEIRQVNLATGKLATGPNATFSLVTNAFEVEKGSLTWIGSAQSNLLLASVYGKRSG